MSDLEQIVDGVEPEETTAAEPVVEVEPEAPVEEVAEEAAPEDAKPEATVPLAAFLDLRKDLQELKSLATPKAEPVAAPDVFEDPKGYQEHMQSAVQQSVSNVKLDISEDMTRTAFGDELVDAAFEDFKAQATPALHQEIMSSRNPWSALVKWHQGQELNREIGGDPAAYKAKVEAEVRAKIEAEMVAKQVTERSAKAAPSMADVTGTGGGPKSNWTGPADLTNVIGE